MKQESISQELWLKNIEEINNYFIKKLKQNELMSIKYWILLNTNLF